MKVSFPSGFSVNAPSEETRLAPLATADLEKLFGGKDNEAYSLADDAASLSRVIEVGRVGRELFPWLMMLIMIVVTVESVLANRFYREAPPRAAVGEAAA